MSHRSTRILAWIAVFALAGCCTMPSAVSDRLFFGRAIPGGGAVTEAEWNAFVSEEIVPRFPSGFTILRGSGHWKGRDGAPVSEDAFVLEVVHGDDRAADAKVAAIAAAYRERFHQDAVMRLRAPITQSFSSR